MRASTLGPGDVVGGRFRIDRVLGQGGMGRVFAATHLVTGAQVALKVLLPGFADDPKTSRRFLREARTAASIDHPNVVVVSDAFDDDQGAPVIVMELLEGTSLAGHVREHGTLALTEALEIFLGVARGVQAAHAQGVVHRDLKPENIFVCRDRDGRWVGKVLDFGIAKILDRTRLQVQSFASATEHGALIGTIPYMSYEQAMGHEVDARTDVWSFAVSFVECVSGRRPLAYSSLGEMYHAFIEQPVPKTASLIPGIGAELAKALDACLAKDCADRAGDLTRVIAVLEGGSVAPKRHRRTTAYGVLGLGVLGVAAALMLARASESPAETRPVPHEPAELAPLADEPVASGPTAQAADPEPPTVAVADAGVVKPAQRPASRRPKAHAPPSAPASVLDTAPSTQRSRLIRKLPD